MGFRIKASGTKLRFRLDPVKSSVTQTLRGLVKVQVCDIGVPNLRIARPNSSLCRRDPKLSLDFPIADVPLSLESHGIRSVKC